MCGTKFYVIDISDEKWEISELNADESVFYKSIYTAVTNRDLKMFTDLKTTTPGWQKFLNKDVLMKVVGQDQLGHGQNVAMNLCHLAAISHAREILHSLIKSGGDLGKRCIGIHDTSNRKKFVLKETLFDLIATHFREPVLFIRRLMDDSIKCHDMGNSYEYVLDFAILHPPVFKSSDGSKQADEDASDHQMTVLNAILNSTDDIHSEQYELLMHPLIESFLTCKWKYYRSFFFLLVMLHFLFVMSLSTAAVFVLRCVQRFVDGPPPELLAFIKGINSTGEIADTSKNSTTLEQLDFYFTSMRWVQVFNVFALITGMFLFIHALIQVPCATYNYKRQKECGCKANLGNHRFHLIIRRKIPYYAGKL